MISHENFQKAMKLQEKRHGPLNSTHDASLDELSEVSYFVRVRVVLSAQKNFGTIKFCRSGVMSHFFIRNMFRFYHLLDHQMEKVHYLQFLSILVIDLSRNPLENFNLMMTVTTLSIM